MSTFSAIISARTTSTRVSNKLLREFAGTTLIDLALEKLNRLDFVEKRYLAVAEDILADRARSFPNVEVLWRKPESISKGDAPLEVRTRHYSERDTDYVLIVNPCHPFLDISTLRQAVDQAKMTNLNSYTSAVPTVDWLYDHEGNAITNTNPKVASTTETRKYFKVAHAFHLIRPSYLREKGLIWSLAKNDPALIEIGQLDALDVDTPLEFEICEQLYAHRNKAPLDMRK